MLALIGLDWCGRDLLDLELPAAWSLGEGLAAESVEAERLSFQVLD